MTASPSSRWSQLTHEHQIEIGGFTITITTDLPCHLWLYWTEYQPWVHKMQRILRGVEFPAAGYWCFVVRNAIEQNETGDTITHTFTWLGWQSCNTRWYTFHGNIGSFVSPSQSPIFSLHYPYCQTFKTSQYDAYFIKYSSISYLDCRDALQATSLVHSWDYNAVGQNLIGATFIIHRTYLSFDTTSFRNPERIMYAILEANLRQNLTIRDFDITLSPANGASEPPIKEDYRLIRDQFASFGSQPTAGWPQGYGYRQILIRLNSTAMIYLRTHPYCQLSIVSSRDISAIPPSSQEEINFWSYDYAHGRSAAKLHLFYYL